MFSYFPFLSHFALLSGRFFFNLVSLPSIEFLFLCSLSESYKSSILRTDSFVFMVALLFHRSNTYSHVYIYHIYICVCIYINYSFLSLVALSIPTISIIKLIAASNITKCLPCAMYYVKYSIRHYLINPHNSSNEVDT